MYASLVIALAASLLALGLAIWIDQVAGLVRGEDRSAEWLIAGCLLIGAGAWSASAPT